MKRLIISVALCCSACSGGSPTTPTPPTTTPPPVVIPPPPTFNVSFAPCPTSIVGFPVEFSFYQQIGCNAFDGQGQTIAVRRWNVAPKLYIRTVDESGAAIDAVTLDTVQNAMLSIASSFTGGKFGLASVERGTNTRENVNGYVTVKWPATAQSFCGLSTIAADGGTISLAYKTTGCSCNGSAITPRAAKHELGHAFGYWHTDSQGDLMSNIGNKPCDQSLSARETQAIAYQYR